MGLHRALSEQRGLRDAEAAGVVAREVYGVRAHVERECAQTRGQEREQGVGVGYRRGDGQVQQHARRLRDEHLGGAGARVDGGRFDKGAARRRKRPLSPVDAAERQVGVGADQTGRQARAQVLVAKVGLRGRRGVLGATAEVGKLGPGDVAGCALGEGCGGFRCAPGDERCCHERHEAVEGEGGHTGSGVCRIIGFDCV